MKATTKQPTSYTLKTIAQNTWAPALLVMIAISAASFIVGWHTHQTHDQYIESRVSNAVEAASPKE